MDILGHLLIMLWMFCNPPQQFALNHQSHGHENKQLFEVISTRSGRHSIDQEYLLSNRETRAHYQCNVESDMAVLLDSSGSIGFANYLKAKHVGAYLIETFTAHPRSRELGIVYSHIVTEVLPLNFSGTPEQKRNKMLEAPYLMRSTKTGAAIHQAVLTFKANQRDVPRSLVVITDGMADDPNNLRQAVGLAQEAGIRMVAVGVGRETNRKELELIAGSGERVFMSSSYEELYDNIFEVIKSMCHV